MLDVFQVVRSPDIHLSVTVQDSQPMVLSYRGFTFSGFQLCEDKPFGRVAEYKVWETCCACGDVPPSACHAWLCMMAVPAVDVGQPFNLL